VGVSIWMVFLGKGIELSNREIVSPRISCTREAPVYLLLHICRRCRGGDSKYIIMVGRVMKSRRGVKEEASRGRGGGMWPKTRKHSRDSWSKGHSSFRETQSEFCRAWESVHSRLRVENESMLQGRE
jgi:hypothetical protein